MGGDYFKLAVPLIVFTILLLDIRRHMEVYQGDRKNQTKFRTARICVIGALILSLLVGGLGLAGVKLDGRLVDFSKTLNLIVLIVYLVFTRFKRN